MFEQSRAKHQSKAVGARESRAKPQTKAKPEKKRGGGGGGGVRGEVR